MLKKLLFSFWNLILFYFYFSIFPRKYISTSVFFFFFSILFVNPNYIRYDILRISWIIIRFYLFVWLFIYCTFLNLFENENTHSFCSWKNIFCKLFVITDYFLNKTFINLNLCINRSLKNVEKCLARKCVCSIFKIV